MNGAGISLGGVAAIQEYALTLDYRPAAKPERWWTLKFQTKPDQRIIFVGPAPTREEITETLVYSMFPVLMIPVIECVVAEMMRYDGE